MSADAAGVPGPGRGPAEAATARSPVTVGEPARAPVRPPLTTDGRAGRGKPARVHRFGATERAVHWIHAVAFFVLTGTGLVMYLPALSERISDRPTLKAIHLTAAVLWFTALVVVAILGDRPALRQAVRELERFDADDRRFLALRRRERPRGWRTRIPQGRFNAAEKSHAIVQGALTVLFVVSGVLLWLGERDTTFRLPGTVGLHDASMYAAGALVLGHLYLALIHRPTRPALRGIVTGEVDAAWARTHHAKWDAVPVRSATGASAAGARARPTVVGLLAATATAVAGVLVVVLVVL